MNKENCSSALFLEQNLKLFDISTVQNNEHDENFQKSDNNFEGSLNFHGPRYGINLTDVKCVAYW